MCLTTYVLQGYHRPPLPKFSASLLSAWLWQRPFLSYLNHVICVCDRQRSHVPSRRRAFQITQQQNRNIDNIHIARVGLSDVALFLDMIKLGILCKICVGARVRGEFNWDTLLLSCRTKVVNANQKISRPRISCAHP